MPERPLLIMPAPEPVDRSQGQVGGSAPPKPTNRRGQAQRIEEQFAEVQATFVSDAPGDVERVLVMETSARIDKLQNAVQRINGLEWLAEMDVDDIELHDLYDEETRKKIRGGRFYILSSNKQATDRLLNLWERYKAGKNLERGYGRFKALFSYLITLRRWDVRDRLRDTGILKQWEEEYTVKKSTDSYMDFEVELHYRADDNKRAQNLQEIRQQIENEGGIVGQSIDIKEVAFQALKANLPVRSIESILQSYAESGEFAGVFSPIFNSEIVRYFRPTGQHIKTEGEIPELPLPADLTPIQNKPPVVALLDGAPLLRHKFLDRRIQLNDPDEYAISYEPGQQKHGTAMASLICHGDLSQPQPKSLTRPIYAHPVMKPDQQGNEKIPADRFQEDIIEKAIREMYEGDAATAPHVRVINLSLGNMDQHYLHEMSPWARLLDWLSFEYKALFIVSAGNYLDELTLADGTGQAALPGIDDSNIRKQVYRGIDIDQRNRRLLSPAESINALTVGALQGDASGDLPENIRGFDPIEDMNLPAPYSRVGPGYRGAIKPEIFTIGGRLLYGKNSWAPDRINPVPNLIEPGVRTAYPSVRPEELDNTAYEAGTSHAAAIMSHGAGHVYETLEELKNDNPGRLSADFDAVLLKALLVHGASWRNSVQAFAHLKNETNKSRFERYLARYIGYGVINIGRVLECTGTRVTAIGYGKIKETERHRFVFPLPASTGIGDYLRLTVTLAWLSPINPRHIGFRRAKLFFECSELNSGNGHQRQEADWQQVRKGTVQHEIFKLNEHNLPGDSLELFVRCAADAGDLNDEIPYGLTVTLEVAETETIDLYMIIKQRIAQQVAAAESPYDR